MTDKYTSADYQRAIGKFVDREVIYCVSSLVDELAKKAESFPEYMDDIFDAHQGLPDYEEALIQNEIEEYRDEYGARCWRADDTNALFDSRAGEHCVGSPEEACEFFDIDAHEYCPEIFEHWIVSGWLADKLEEHGERVLRDFFGLTIWCRSTSGQAILLDHVICEIYDETQEAAA